MFDALLCFWALFLKILLYLWYVFIILHLALSMCVDLLCICPSILVAMC